LDPYGNEAASEERASGPVSTIEPYFIGLDRAMVSLGPLTEQVYCTYKCTFCYVRGPYQKYARRSVDEIFDWLKARRDDYKIVYVSGDTDSFAPPRTAQGLDLLSLLADLERHVLFTTRYVFNRDERDRLLELRARYAVGELELIPCVSVCQLHHPGLEPRSIPSPEARLEQLRWFHEHGFKVVLTIRPFMPYIEPQEYVEIVEKGGPHCAVVLGGHWYTDPDGVIDGSTRRSLGLTESQLDPGLSQRGRLDSTYSEIEWDETPHPEAIAAVEAACKEIDRPFFMRSSGALDHLIPRWR